MEYELEVFEVYDENEQSSNKKHKKHTRKKCKQKKSSLTNSDTTSRIDDINRSKNSVVSESHEKPVTLRQSILNVFSKIVIWKNNRRYQTPVPDKADSPHTSKDTRRSFIPFGKLTIYRRLLFHLNIRYRF